MWCIYPVELGGVAVGRFAAIFNEQEVTVSILVRDDGTVFIPFGGQCGVRPVDWRRGGEGEQVLLPPAPSGCSLSVCPAPAGEEAPPPGSQQQQPAASLLLSPALCSALRCSALLRPCGLARRRSFLRDNKSAERALSTEDGSALWPLTGAESFSFLLTGINHTCLR